MWVYELSADDYVNFDFNRKFTFLNPMTLMLSLHTLKVEP